MLDPTKIAELRGLMEEYQKPVDHEDDRLQATIKLENALREAAPDLLRAAEEGVAAEHPSPEQIAHVVGDAFRVEYRAGDNYWHVHRKDGSFVFSGTSWQAAWYAAKSIDELEKERREAANEAARMREAIEQIKAIVCGDKHPRWADGGVQMRMLIADLCDAVVRPGKVQCNKDAATCPERAGGGA